MNWKCPYCERDTTLIGQQITTSGITTQHSNAKPTQKYYGQIFMLTCPNSECKKTTVSVEVYSKARFAAGRYHLNSGSLFVSRRLVPASMASQLHESVPKAVIEDFEEAHTILYDSPKSAATLARRAIQGMIRDFHSVTKPTLYKEIEALKGVIDSDIWDAIDAVRKVGNIGAHMEKDVNIIIDVEPGEAELLLKLIEMLSSDWYKAKAERGQQLADIRKLGTAKTAAKEGQA